MHKIDDCREIRLALTRAGIATGPEKLLQTFRLVVPAQYIDDILLLSIDRPRMIIYINQIH
jgi:hypothetical protein